MGVVLLALLLTVDQALFIQRHDLPLAYSAAAFLLPFLACTIYGGSVEEAERRKIRATFGRYMSDELVAQLVEDPRHWELELIEVPNLEHRVSGYRLAGDGQDSPPQMVFPTRRRNGGAQPGRARWQNGRSDPHIPARHQNTARTRALRRLPAVIHPVTSLTCTFGVGRRWPTLARDGCFADFLRTAADFLRTQPRPAT
jgi:hypothetical protein